MVTDELNSVLQWMSLQACPNLEAWEVQVCGCPVTLQRAQGNNVHDTVTPSRDLTGHMVWPCAKLATRNLELRPNLVHASSVIELGSGCGLVGITAALCGAKQVVVTDGDATHTLDLLRQNTSRVAKRHKLQNLECHPTALRWGVGQQEDLVCTAELLHQYGAFDIVLASDVLYPGSQPTAFFAMARNLLEDDGTLMLALAARPALPPGWRFVHEVFEAAACAGLYCIPDSSPLLVKSAQSIRAVLYFGCDGKSANDRCDLGTAKLRQRNRAAFERIYNRRWVK